MKATQKKIRVLKFSGTALANVNLLHQAKNIIMANPDNKVIVVSGFGDIRVRLKTISAQASIGDDNFREEFKKIEREHIAIARELVSPEKHSGVLATVKVTLNKLEDLLNGVSLLRELSSKTRDHILHFGTWLAAYILSESINDAILVDACNFIKTDSKFGAANVDLSKTEKQIKEDFPCCNNLAVVTGGVGSNDDGSITILGRGGSDHTATIFAAALDAEVVELWKDVDGFKTANPRLVPSAYSIHRMSYSEAIELSHFGAKVMFVPAIQPVYQKQIPILIKNILNLDFPGTIIDNGNDSNASIKGISCIESVSLITVQGSGIIGVPGISKRIFNALASKTINIILIAQASSEYSVSFAVAPDDAQIAASLLAEEFKNEITDQLVSITTEKQLSILAIVGENMRHAPGIAAKLFSILGRNGINVVAIAQGVSELNISVVIPEKSIQKALNTIHEGFFLSECIHLHLFVVGIGTVGGDLLRQIGTQQKMLEKEHRLRIKVVGITNSRKMYFDKEGIDLSSYRDSLGTSSLSANLTKFVEHIKTFNLPNSVFVDCTANDTVPKYYEDLMNSYCSIVTANKIACSSSYKTYQKLKKLSKDKNVKFLYETNVGAGLPIISTIGNLIKSGDKISKFEAVVSGTLNFIFNTLSSDVPMSKTIKMAQDAGYSEPDPRIDLCGKDVMRKLLILARECGYPLEAEDIAVHPFLPESCFNTPTLDTFWKEVPNVDADFEKRRKKLEAEGKRWRYVAKFENGKAETALQEVDAKHPFYQLEGNDNILSVYTDRYRERPLVIKGAGAGAAVTATGVFSDIISIANV